VRFVLLVGTAQLLPTRNLYCSFSGYSAMIPAQPLGTTVHYTLLAETLAGMEGRWPTAGEQTFMITPSCTLEIRGAPVAWGAVDPAYGAHVMASGVTVRATAPARVVEAGGVSRRLLGCLGTGSVTSTPLAQIDVALNESSTLTWLWQTENALQYTSPVPGLLTYSTWFALDVVTTSAVAPETAVWLGQTLAFAGWYVDGQRQPAAPGAALNPVPGIAMTSPRTAYAHYLPVQQDADGQGIPDWWEFRYFGVNGWPISADDDGDGFDTAQEYADWTDPLDPASYPQPPMILHTPLAPTQDAPPPYTIRAAFTDSRGIEQALLLWRRNGDHADHHQYGKRDAAVVARTGGLQIRSLHDDRLEHPRTGPSLAHLSRPLRVAALCVSRPAGFSRTPFAGGSGGPALAAALPGGGRAAAG